MDKMLYVWFKQPDKIPDGGMLANQRNFELMQDVVGKDAIDSFYIHPHGERVSLMDQAKNVLGFLSNLHNGITNKMIDYILSISNNYQYIFLSTSLFGCIAKALRENGYHGKIIVHFHNVESIYYDAAVSRYLPLRQIIINSAASNDEWACKYADVAIVLNIRDRDILESQYHRKIDYVMPITLRDNYKGIPTNAMTSEKPLCTFIGSNFSPNRDGILWFIKNVLPKVRMKLQIVGKGMDSLKINHITQQDISVYSNVQDLSPYIEESDFMLFPIFSGSGMKVKTCEALMFGKNIIATNESFVGYDIDTNKAGACCNTADEFINVLENFANSPIKLFNEYSRKSFLEKYSYTSSLESVKQMMKTISRN